MNMTLNPPEIRAAIDPTAVSQIAVVGFIGADAVVHGGGVQQPA